GGFRMAQRKMMIRLAPRVLAVAARSAVVGQWSSERASDVSVSIAGIQPSSGLAESHRMSASLIGPRGVDMIRRRSEAPSPGSMMIRLPDNLGPDRRTISSSRMACGDTPVTREPRKYNERKVSGPQMPSG